MATAYFVQDGNTIDYTPSGAIAEGDIVILNSELVGVAQGDIAANTKGALAISGVFKFTTADTFVAGEAAYIDASTLAITDDTDDIYAGRVVETVTSGTTVKVRINFMSAPAGS